jgi:hypothetical protein
LEVNLNSKKKNMLISWNNLNIFKWNNTYLHLYEITCKYMYEIKKIQWFKKNWKDTKIPKDIEKNKEICLFQYLRIHKDILKHYNL